MKPVILYVGGFCLPDKNAAAHRVLANGKILEQLGYAVHYLGVNYEKSLSRGRYDVLMPMQAEIGYPKSLSDWLTFLGDIQYILTYIRQTLKQKPDAIFAYNYPAVGLWKLKNYCRKENIKLIADCTEWYQPTGNPVFRLIKGFDTSLRMKYIQPKLDGMIAISRYLYDYYSVRMKNVVQIPPLKDATEEKFQLAEEMVPEDELRFVYAGSPGDTKDKLSLMMTPLSDTVAKHQRPFRFEIIGLTKEQYEKNFGQKIPENLQDNIHFFGRISHSEVIRKVKQASFSVFLREDNLVTRAGFPTKFAEAITCGTPVLTNPSSNITDYLTDGKNGYLLDISSQEIMCNVLEQIFSLDAQSIEQMKKNCRDSRLFHYENYTEQIKQLLK